ncbi:hypothetical protein P041_01280 [Brucella sp. 04-5288]|nr:hypothetical protein P041_01280 [Brucella sp. 04-5288]
MSSDYTTLRYRIPVFLLPAGFIELFDAGQINGLQGVKFLSEDRFAVFFFDTFATLH